MTGISSSPFSTARYVLATVCASTPWAASTTSRAPSQAARLRETSQEKSTCPGGSIRCRWGVSRAAALYSTRTACALIVIPRSRSRSIESSICACIFFGSTAPVTSRMRSARVDLPWSMWAMMQKLRMRSMGVPEYGERPRSATGKGIQRPRQLEDHRRGLAEDDGDPRTFGPLRLRRVGLLAGFDPVTTDDDEVVLAGVEGSAP